MQQVMADAALSYHAWCQQIAQQCAAQASLCLCSQAKAFEHVPKEAVAVRLGILADQRLEAAVPPHSLQVWVLSDLLIVLIASF